MDGRIQDMQTHMSMKQLVMHIENSVSWVEKLGFDSEWNEKKGQGGSDFTVSGLWPRRRFLRAQEMAFSWLEFHHHLLGN